MIVGSQVRIVNEQHLDGVTGILVSADWRKQRATVDIGSGLVFVTLPWSSVEQLEVQS